ncbi:MAG: hypothetical protein J7623_01185 [Chitinophaga sp.]|uniref:hypothetical protein n=1 Tax=Chitinophaga sp. TaxID=1869181 RepID=UPI001B02733B|nr:hypothetical protein [Chitinophaga sp.]MBO9727228.1 hypothetical protein [Chitinophaga sp.]
MNLKNWSSIYEYWISLNVPDVTFIKFNREKHSPHSPWFEKNRQAQFYFSENPILNTGAHLGRYLKDKPKELIAAYKIFAFLRFNQLDDSFNFIIDEPFKKFNENYRDWWNASAKHIFPYYSSINHHYFPRSFEERKKIQITSIIDAAAQAWTDIANEWALIIIPGYMDRNSNELGEYWDAVKKEEDEREFREYLRLKKKYEARNNEV